LVLPVGGIKEKVLAAHRAGIKRVILPERCKKDMLDVPEQARKEIEFIFVTQMDEVLKNALESNPFKAHPPPPVGEPGKGQLPTDVPPVTEIRVRA
jgi:ATP-dependent Lon protease